VNVLDSAINYRGQRSERAIGRAVARAIESGLARREEIFVSTKGGYLPHDAEDPRPARRYVAEEFVASGLAPREEIAAGCHCLAPAYLRDQIARSRRNLGLETIDLYYLHNIETQLEAVDRETFRRRLAAAIETLEAETQAGRIAAWGLATWNGLRVPPEHPEHVSIGETLRLAETTAGSGHHFRAVQLPVNLGMAQGVVYRSQDLDGRRVPALEAAQILGLAAFGSASMLQGRLAVGLPEEIEAAFPEVESEAQRALQFARSAPGMTAALVGVSTPAHAEEDFALARVPPAEADRILGLF
jgi:aryl-alcohol dehydrogenase-like predicted oxidoreductase